MKTILGIGAIAIALRHVIYPLLIVYALSVYSDIEKSKIESNEMIEVYKKTNAWG
jgi:hypothetical protein